MIQKWKQKRVPEWIILFMLGVFFATSALVELLHFPLSFQLVLDAGWCSLGVIILLNWRELWNASIYVKIILGIVVAFFFSTFIGLALGYQSILYYLWGIRNNFSFFVFFFACVLFLKAEDLEDYLKYLEMLFVANFLISLYQFFVLGYKQDFLGGLFGTAQGCNGRTNVFMMVIVSNSMIRYLNQKEKAWKCLLICTMSLIVAALAELKMFILEFGVIVVLAVLLTKFSKRKLYLLIGSCIGALISIRVLIMIFPGWAGWFTWYNIWNTATSSAGYNGWGVEVNRLTAIPIAWNTYLTTWPQKLFGLGLGHCDYTMVSFLVSPFYTQYGHILYTWFHSGFLMLETGLVGVVLYLSVFVGIFFVAHSIERKNEDCAEYCQLAKIMAAMCFVLFIYNDTLRTYPGYLVFFVLALPFVKAKKN